MMGIEFVQYFRNALLSFLKSGTLILRNSVEGFFKMFLLLF